MTDRLPDAIWYLLIYIDLIDNIILNIIEYKILINLKYNLW